MVAAVVSWDRALEAGRVTIGLEMAGNSAVTLRETAYSLLIHIMPLKCMSFLQLEKYLYYMGQPCDWTRM